MTTSSAASRIQANLGELFTANLAPGDAHIRFQLTSETTALLSMEQVQESLVVEAERLTPLPKMPSSVIGMISSRDRVFCVFDLAELLGLSSQSIARREYQIIVLQTTSERPICIGLAVGRIQGITRLTKEQIQPPSDALPPQIAPYLCGAVEREETMIPIFDFDRILEALTTASFGKENDRQL
jgi:twitching motility protein PilI